MSTGIKNPSVGGMLILLLVIINVIILKSAYISNEKLYGLLVITLPMLLIAFYFRKPKLKKRPSIQPASYNKQIDDHQHKDLSQVTANHSQS